MVIHIGTSGWSYAHWDERFYPTGTHADERLRYYATRFETVEINASFYGLPKEPTVDHWASQVPLDFAFAAKGSRYLTHFKKLRDPADPIERFMSRMRGLGDRLRVVLWQLPPGLDKDVDLLRGFVDALPNHVRHAVEFRETSWLADDVYDVLAEARVATVQVDSDAMPSGIPVTTDLAYVRFHGRTGYHGAYAEPQLESWAEFLRAQASDAHEAFVYFNNDAEGHAPIDAERLRGMLPTEFVAPLCRAAHTEVGRGSDDQHNPEGT